MHEIAISETILKIISAEAEKRGMKKVASAQLKIGKMRAFKKENLMICLKGYGESSIISGIDFSIEETDVTLKCIACGNKFTDARFDDHHFAHSISHAPEFYVPENCKKCGSKDIVVLSGNEMELISISD